MADTRESKPKVREVYGPWTGGMHFKSDPQLIPDNSLYYVSNLDFTIDGGLIPRPPIRCIRRTTVTGLSHAPYKVLGFDNYGSLGVAILARITYNGTPAETGTVFEFVNGAESTSKTYAAQMITTGIVTPVTSTDVGFYKYLWYDTKGYFLSTVASKSFSVTDLTGTGKTALANVPVSGTDAFIFKDRMWIIAGKRVYYSKATDPTIWAAPDGGFFDILSEDEHDPITTFAIVRDTIYFFKRNSAYQFNYSSDPGSDGYLRTVSKVMGAVNAVVYNGLVFVLDVRGIYQFVNDQFICISDSVTRQGIPNKYYRLMIYNDRLWTLLNPIGVPTWRVLDFNTGLWTEYTVNEPYSGTFDYTWVAINPLVDTEGADALVFATGNSVYTFSDNSNLKYDMQISSGQVRSLIRPDAQLRTKNFTFDDDLTYKKLTTLKLSGKIPTGAYIDIEQQNTLNMNSSDFTITNNLVLMKGLRFRDLSIQLFWDNITAGLTDDFYSAPYPYDDTNYKVDFYLRRMILDVEVDETYGGH